jgi:hypothetical protein
MSGSVWTYVLRHRERLRGIYGSPKQRHSTLAATTRQRSHPRANDGPADGVEPAPTP